MDFSETIVQRAREMSDDIDQHLVKRQADIILEKLVTKLPELSEQQRVSIASLYNLLDNEEDSAVKIAVAPSEKSIDRGPHATFKRKLGQEVIQGWNFGEPDAAKRIKQFEHGLLQFYMESKPDVQGKKVESERLHLERIW